jgi:hypothetical protein
MTMLLEGVAALLAVLELAGVCIIRKKWGSEVLVWR